MRQNREKCFLALTIVFGFGVEDVAAPLCQVGQHAEHSLNAELRKAGGRLLTTSASSSITVGQHGQHLLRYLEAGMSLLLLHETNKTPHQRLV